MSANTTQARPKVGIALGGGGAKGLAHLGVLEVLIKNGIPIDLASGTSMGAVIAAIYACGTDIDMTIRFAENFREKDYLDIGIKKKGLIKGEEFQKVIATLTKNRTFDRTNIPLSVVACDIETGERVLLNEGLIHQAVRASISIPGVFVPYQLGEHLLVDGGVVENLPVSVVKDMGADVIIAVDVGFRGTLMRKLDGMMDVAMQALEIMSWNRTRNSPVQPDVLITPNMEGMSALSNSQPKECIQRGREAATKKLPEIKELLGL